MYKRPHVNPIPSARLPMRMRLLSRMLAVAIATSASLSQAQDFSEQVQAVSEGLNTQPEAKILELLVAGSEQQQPAKAYAIAKQWLTRNLVENPTTLYHTARNAELSGDWREAANFYQQFLSDADLSSPEASKAISAIYSLWIDQLRDTDSAYNFGHLQASRLAVNPRFRQYDRWFLDQARQRGDVEALANRLLATAQAGVSNDYLETYHLNDLKWLLDFLDGRRLGQRPSPVTDQVVATIRELAKELDFDAELQLSLPWKAAVLRYNLDRIEEQQTQAPLEDARDLLAKFPNHALQVQTDWAGGSRGRYYRGSPKKYWPHQLEMKLPPINDALEKLSAFKQAKFVQSWSRAYYSGTPVVVDPESALDLVLSKPQFINQRWGPQLGFDWSKLAVEQARKLASPLQHNPSPEASLVRTIAHVGESKDYDQLMDHLLSEEVWRLGARELGKLYADRLWHYAGKPGGNAKRDQQIKRSRSLLESIPDAKMIQAMPAQQRLQRFRQLWKDYRSPKPSTPDLINQIKRFATHTPEAVAELITDSSTEAQFMASQLISEQLKDGDSPLYDYRSGQISTQRYSPYMWKLADRHRGMEQLKAKKDLYQPHPLLPALKTALTTQMVSKQVEPWLVMAWLNAQFPDDHEQSALLVQKLVKSPAWKDLPFRVRYGLRVHFPEVVMSPAQQDLMQAAESASVCQGLLELKADTPAETATETVKQATQSILNAPFRVEVTGLAQLTALSDETWSDATFTAAIADMIDRVQLFKPNQHFGYRLIAYVATIRDTEFILKTAPYLWRSVEHYRRKQNEMMQLTDALTKEEPQAASTLARIGLQVIARHTRGHTWFNADTITQLKRIRGKTAMALGLVEIPVGPGHPTYPIYRSQAEWMTENIATASKLLDANWEEFLEIHRSLSFSYTMWVLQRSIDSREEERQERLIKSLLDWSEEAPGTLRPTEKAEIEIAYGDIAMQRGQLRQAHEIYHRVAQKKAYADLMIRHQATLRKATAERVAKDFDSALQTLSTLELERIPGLWTEIRYARAEVHFAMEAFDEAKDDVESILAREPTHPDSKILLGKIQLKREKLMEATEIELGATTGQKSLVPGQKLKVTLIDPTLAVSGAGTEIEVVVWTVTGDREQFFLRQFGDQKTKFRGEVATALGAPSPDDGTLQVIGDDEIYYAFSERFREKMNNLGEQRGGPIRVASDALLMASARKLLSGAEQRQADMQAMMDEIKGAVGGDLEAAARAKLATQTLQSDASTGDAANDEFGRYLVNVVKPGNPIHVRVIDPDRSRTPEIDELNVSVSTSSGDSIGLVTLQETDTHSGWFEGSIETVTATARALSRDTETGLNPNMVISPNTNYPAWRAIVRENRKPEFVVDLNDRVGIDRLNLTASEPGAALKKFIVQTAPNHQSWTTVATYPKTVNIFPANPNLPSATVILEAGRDAYRGARSVYQIKDLRRHMAYGWFDTPEMATAKNVVGPSEALPASILTDVKWPTRGRLNNPAVVFHLNAYFHEADDVERYFKLKLGKHDPLSGPVKASEKKAQQEAEFLIAVNKKVITHKENNPLQGSIELSSGVHRFEIWATGWLSNIGFGRDVQLLTRTSEDADWVPCPDVFFNPRQFPEGSFELKNHPATVQANEDGTRFTVDFAPDSETRLIRFLLIDQEGPTPSINKIALTDNEGQQILPLEEDFADLNKNSTLEILTNDRVTVRYRDDRFVTPNKENQERFLAVSFTNAGIEFADMEPRYNGKHREMRPYYERLIRFQHEEPLSLAVHDADMDTTVEADRVTVTLSNGTGQPKSFEAIETGDSTGIFKLTIIPVKGLPQKENEFQVAEKGALTATYTDRENNRPGVPTERVATIHHAAFTQPQFLMGHAQVTKLEAEGGSTDAQPVYHGFQVQPQQAKSGRRAPIERITPRWSIQHQFFPPEKAPEGGFKTVLGQSMYFELVAPQYALGTNSTVTVYAQTESGRRKAKLPKDAPFNTDVPGTIKLTGMTGGKLSDRPKVQQVGTHREHNPWGPYDKGSDDRFRFATTVIPGIMPEYGVLTAAERDAVASSLTDSRSAQPTATNRGSLVAQPGDTIYIGFRYTGPNGGEQWHSVATQVVTQPAFDIMAEDYRHRVEQAYAGERLYLRVVDLGSDLTNGIDTARVLMQAKSGAKHYLTLKESGPHTGIFRDDVLLNYNKDPKSLPENFDVARDGFPITYGDSVAARYSDANGITTKTRLVTISKGADGMISPFSKKYEDEEIAMRTQFSLAEAYLEMAKRHRILGQTEKAEQEYRSAKMLLAKAMDQFTAPETRAHAEYLLGTLTMEEADATEEADLRETRFRAALSRFMNVTGSYPLTIHASRAQYRIATIYEKLGEPNIAAQEYVKLAYKYPDSEYLATSMARLGTHFLKQASSYEQEAKPLLARAEEDRDAAFEGEALQKLAVREYLKTASIFSRLQERFPGNKLAGPAGLRAGQAYMRAGHNQDAIQTFNKVIREDSYDGPEVRAQAMYWVGMCYQQLQEEMAAYSHFKRLTYDFPESKWASYARAQLSQGRLLRLESQLEIERLEAAQ